MKYTRNRNALIHEKDSETKSWFWKYTQNWQTFSQTYQEKTRNSNKLVKVGISQRVPPKNEEAQKTAVHSCVNKPDYLEETDIVLDMCNLSRLHHDEMENLNRSITHKEIRAAIKTLSAKESSGPDGFGDELY